MNLDFDLYEILACPHCHGTLSRNTDELTCSGCHRAYPVLDGIPVFVQSHHTPEFEAQYESTDSMVRARFGDRVHQLLWRLNRFPLVLTTESRELVKTSLPRLLAGDAKILNLGSGEFTQHSEFIHEFAPRVVNLDIALFGDVHIVADAHQLPFSHETFDLVYMSCVLEHVRDAAVVVRECYRVLGSGGYVYSTTPFLSRFHSDSDYSRWTAMGLDYLFRDFERVAGGVHCGPGSAIALALRDFIPLFLGTGYAYWAAKFIMGWLLTPVAYLDPLLVRNPRSYKLAQSLYFLGQKQM